MLEGLIEKKTLLRNKHKELSEAGDLLMDFYNHQSVESLIRESERLKFNKQFNKAVQVLQIAQNKLYAKKELNLEYLLKLPMYFQLAGNDYEGHMEFYRIKTYLYNLHSENMLSLEELFLKESKLSEVMSTFYERKKNTESTVFFQIKSYIESITSLYHIVEKQRRNLNEAKHENNIDKIALFSNLLDQGKEYLKIKTQPFQMVFLLSSLLNRLNSLDYLKELFNLTQSHIKKVPQIDILSLENSVNEIFSR